MMMGEESAAAAASGSTLHVAHAPSPVSVEAWWEANVAPRSDPHRLFMRPPMLMPRKQVRTDGRQEGRQADRQAVRQGGRRAGGRAGG